MTTYLGNHPGPLYLKAKCEVVSRDVYSEIRIAQTRFPASNGRRNEGQQDLMFRSIIAIAATIAILGGCASANEMLELEPRAKFQAKNELPQFRDCLFRWSSSRLYTLEYNPEGIFVKSGGALCI